MKMVSWPDFCFPSFSFERKFVYTSLGHYSLIAFKEIKGLEAMTGPTKWSGLNVSLALALALPI